MKKIILLSLIALFSGCGFFEDDSDSFWGTYTTQDLYNNEIHPSGSSIENGYDATLEEVLHLITQNGYAYAYPNVFGESKGTTIAGYMDTARGGHYESVPASYPDEAWYHYNDTSCEYSCQITEYFYWSLTSILGSQNYMNGSETRLQQIDNEWELNTSAKMSTSDPNMHALMTDGTYTMPTVIPSGVYTKSAEIGIEVSSSLPNELSAIDAYFTSHISVFGIHIVGTSRVDNDKLLHSAYVLAEYLDNNQDGTVDDPNILEEMLNKNCVLTVTYDSDEIESIRSSVD